MQKSPPPFIWACPEEKNILDWHFIIRGPPDTPYAGGEYHGLIWFPSDYPFKPPDVKMFTPSGRFEIGHKICMSMTSYHPSTWNAAWSVATILTGLLSFMLSEEITAGAVRSTDEEKRTLAKKSHAFNISSKKFREIFPTYATTEMTDLPDMGHGPSAKPVPKGVNPAFSSSTPESSAQSTVSSAASTPSPPDTQTTTNLVNSVSAPRTAPQTPAPAAAPERRIVPPARNLPDARHAGTNRWMPSWRWILAVVVLAVLGRLSSFAGL
ncbi:Ubiquitin-conjugating enzyme E2 6 [Saitozyma podzolica]|uniref:Ubiquitin-conjugating enzyme E2 6 n=1 Tax=Saitozyma podzolica TaxID=1890683 RepID=A0A427YV17_9TREE|nr:Ubiquitin-conjugating enzyme E2 6 [Saitozyma podzolica]